MRAQKRTVWSISVAALLLAAWTAEGQPARQVDDAALKNAGKTGTEWITYGLNYNENRFSPLRQIDATNVSRLGLSWSYEVGPGGGGQEATPLVWNGTLYGITNWSIVFAVDARTGKEKWRWDPEINQPAVRPKICCGIVNRGLALYEGMILAPVNDGRLEALNAETGKPVWEARVAYPQEGYTVTMAPRVVKGKVIIGVAGGEFPVRGFFDAYDAKTGQRAWRFYTVPGDPSKPFESDAMRKAAATWENDYWKLGGGATVWDGIAYDPDADLIYVGTGNAGPWPEDIRKQKGKDNLYVCSVLAVKPDTGKLEWYFQMVPGDSWDFDSVQQLLLADLTIKGRARKVIMQANKNGFYYVLDRVTGEFISGQPFAEVTWAKGLDEKSGRPIVNQEAHYDSTSKVSVAPGPGGAHNWSPMSFNPSTGLVYIPIASTGGFAYQSDPNFNPKPGQMNMGIVFGFPGFGGPAPAPVPTRTAPPAIGPNPPAGQRGGALVAWDPVTQQEKWRRPGGGSIGGGTVTTAGNLVFQVIPDGRLVAYSADKGDKLLDVQTGLRGGMGPPVTYELDGKQYVSILGGTGPIVNPFGGGGNRGGNRGGANAPAPGTTGEATNRGGTNQAANDNQAEDAPAFPNPSNAVRPKLLTFVLDGKEPLPVSQPADAPKP
ncbi:MAG: PQQ-dependent dehydrogenase, methanol/ethanol family [Acidobacteriia bacterium]|nr:PQQ-dependent dehydrogenase, methanol/ethanol family [Terriglobia bacterium]